MERVLIDPFIVPEESKASFMEGVTQSTEFPPSLPRLRRGISV